MKVMYRNIIYLMIAAFTALYGCAHTVQDTGQGKSPQWEGPVYEETLSNGLKVIAVKDTNSPMAIFEIWYDAGSINEPLGKSGLSHLLEHMMFKGTPAYGPNVFSTTIKRAGGLDNAGTSKDYVYYFQKLSADRLNLSIEMEADRMRNLILDPDETLSERDVVMEERRMRYDDDPQNLVYEEVLAAAFKNHPYGRPVIGWMEDLKTITRDDLWQYYRSRYVPNNAFIVVAGNIDIEDVTAKIRKEFGNIPIGTDLKALDIGEPVQQGERRVYVKKEAELPYVFSAYKAPNIQDEDTYALDILVSVLSEGKSARIYRSLIDEKRIALSAGAGYSNIQKYPHLFYLYGTALPGKTIEEVENALYEEVQKIKDHPPEEKEVQRAKNQVEADFIMNQDSLYYQAMMIAWFEMAGDWRLRDAYLEGIRNVTPEDVQQAARKYLIEDKRTVGVLIPVKNQKAK
jgi:zinc protease